jgi:hypothetical protein
LVSRDLPADRKEMPGPRNVYPMLNYPECRI